MYFIRFFFWTAFNTAWMMTLHIPRELTQQSGGTSWLENTFLTRRHHRSMDQTLAARDKSTSGSAAYLGKVLSLFFQL
jgi:hypothetical protein